jgi:hypothetical protein
MIPQEGRGLAIVTARGRVPAGKLAAETDAGNRRTQLPPECPKAQFFSTGNLGRAWLNLSLRRTGILCMSDDLLFGDDEVPDFIRSLARAAHGMTGLRPWEGDTGGPDPIFAAIAAHRSAWAASVPMAHLDQAHTPEAEAKLSELHDAVSEVEERLDEIEPTTMAGAIALSRYVAKFEASGRSDPRGIHRNVANALEKLVAGA